MGVDRRKLATLCGGKSIVVCVWLWSGRVVSRLYLQCVLVSVAVSELGGVHTDIASLTIIGLT